jgi:DNA-binding NtrC family response regulator
VALSVGNLTSAGRARILLVDDDEGIRENVMELLESQDYAVMAAKDAAEALTILDSEPIDLLLTDFQMPGANGVELIEAARKARGDLPAILMTGYLSVYDQLDAERKKQVTLLRKPFEPNEILRLVGERLANAGVAAP